MPASATRPPAPSSALSCTERTWTLWGPDGAVDVDVRTSEASVLADVLPAVATALGRPAVQLWAGSTVLPGATPLTAGPLRHGADLGLDQPGPRGATGPTSGALELHVTGGPDAGRTVPLGQGPLVLGRGAGCGLTIADPDVSRRHAVVAVSGGRVTVVDVGSSNGTCLSAGSGAGEPVGARPQEWPVGAALEIGSSTLRLTGPRGAPLEQVPAPGGRHLLRPLPETPPPEGSAVVRLPTPPVAGARRRLGWVAVALPAVGGLVMAWVLSTPQFLFFALLSPVVAVAGWASDRVTGRRAHRRELAAHAVSQALAETELAAAVDADLAARDAAHPDPARLAAAARRRCSPLWSRPPGPGGVTVRLGTGPGATTVTKIEPDGERTTATAVRVPVTLSLAAAGGLGIVGPRQPALAVARSLICQLTALNSPAQLEVVLACTPERVAAWRWARWLPQLRAVVLPGEPVPAALQGPAAAAGGGAPTTVVVLDGPVDQDVAEALDRGAGQLVRLDVAGSEAALALPGAACLELAGETGTTGRLRSRGADPERLLTLDALSESTAARLARDLAGLAVPAAADELPDTARLLDLPGSGLTVDGAQRASGTWDRSRARLRSVLGTTGQRPLHLDLVADGPHALIAGTTGSGKSELLQTLVASLALHHPPDRCAFLLVDYKGGAAFGEAATLPHTVGVLTDLDHRSTARALRSLTAELTRRERLLAEHRVRDLADLPDPVPTSRLVIVVDEFATLAEELPGFVPGLVGIAQRGRSLGVHLVLATQRPAGVVSPEIRANCSLRICLRTTDPGDARDVLGSAVAAQLPPDRPGRAYLRSGSAEPVLFQVARVSGACVDAGPVAQAWRSPWPPVRGSSPSSTAASGTATDLQRLVAALSDRARSAGLRPPDRPWWPPLPDLLAAEDLDRWAAGAAPTRLRIGLVDEPDAQRQTPLELDLATGGGWLLVGGARSGRTTALTTVLTEAVCQLPPRELHVHVLDHGGGALARAAAALPHCGTTVGRDDAHRSLRLLTRLSEDVDRRRGAGPAGEPLVLVLVDGYESVLSQLEDADPATGASGLLRLVRDGAAVGVTVVLTAERAVPGSRVAGAVGTRLVLPLPDRADYAVAGIPARAVPGHRPPGRALAGEDAVECQVALPRQSPAICPDPPGAVPTGHPIRVSTLAPDPELPLPSGEPRGDAGSLWLPLGPGGDDGETVGLDLQRTGGLLVVGPPGSGRSAALDAFTQHCVQAGAAVVVLADAPGAVSRSPSLATLGAPAARWPAARRLDRADADGLRAFTAGREGQRPLVVVADDLPSLPDPMADALAALAGARPLVLAAGTAVDLAASFRGPAVTLRRSRTALLLRPAAGDAELLGLRSPRTPLPPRPGAGWLLTPAQATRVQVARRRRSAAP